jgi:hypothetical protein
MLAWARAAETSYTAIAERVWSKDTIETLPECGSRPRVPYVHQSRRHPLDDGLTGRPGFEDWTSCRPTSDCGEFGDGAPPYLHLMQPDTCNALSFTPTQTPNGPERVAQGLTQVTCHWEGGSRAQDMVFGYPMGVSVGSAIRSSAEGSDEDRTTQDGSRLASDLARNIAGKVDYRMTNLINGEGSAYRSIPQDFGGGSGNDRNLLKLLRERLQEARDKHTDMMTDAVTICSAAAPER